MSCQIKYNEQNQITKVLTPEGVESQLYNTIAKSVMVEDPLAVYKNKYTKKFQDIAEEDISFGYRVNDQTFSSYKQALLSAQENQSIEAGFNYNSEFIPLLETKKSTNKTSLQGYVNYAIENNLLEDTKVKVGAEYLYQSFGQDDLSKAVVAELVVTDAIPHLGLAGVQKIGSSFRLSNKKEIRRVLDKQGNMVEVPQTELDSMTVEELNERFEYGDEIIFARELHKATPAYRENDLTDGIKTDITEEQLQLRLLNFLNKLGVKVTSISNYVKNYNIRNGVNPSAQALADIANRVVAFREGTINTQDLTEEVAHFIVEALPQNETADVLRNIDKSEEYKQFADVYREIYRDEYSEAELENAVRREVLGKVVANSIASNFSVENKTEVQQNFIQKALDFIESFFNTVRTYFQPQYVQELNQYIQAAQDLLDSEELTDKVNTDNFTNNKYRLYSVEPKDTLRKNLLKLVEDLTVQERGLRKTGAGSKINAVALQNIQRQLETAVEKSAVAEVISMAKHSANYIRKAIEDSKSKNKNYFLSSEENIVYQNLKGSLKETLSSINSLIENKKEWQDVYKASKEVVADIQGIEGYASIVENQTVERWIDDLMEKNSWPESHRTYIKQWLDRAQSDTNIFHTWFGQLTHAKDSMLGLLGYMLETMHNEHHQEWTADITSLTKVMDENGIQVKYLDQFLKDGFYISEWDMPRFVKDLNNNFIKAYKQVVTGSTLTDEEIIEKRDSRTLEMSEEQEGQIRKIEKDLNSELIERPMNEQYYRDYEQRMTEANISDITKNYLSAYLGDVSSIKQKAKLPNGRTDITQLSLQDRQRLEDLEENRRRTKSSFTESGKLKTGIEYQRNEDGSIKKDERGNPLFQLTFNPTEAAIVALDLQRLDNSFSQTANRKNNGIPDAFFEELQRVENEFGREEALNFINLNAFTGFSSVFWDNLGSNKSIVDKLQTAKTNDPSLTTEIDKIVDDITMFNSQMKGILRLFSRKNNPAEIAVEKMPEVARDSVKTYQESLNELYNRAKKYITVTEEEIQENENLVRGVSGANDSFTKELINQDIEFTDNDTIETRVEKLQQQVEFVKQHATDTNKKLLTEAQFAIEDFRAGKRRTVPQSIEKLLTRYNLTAEDLLEDSTYVDFMRQYAETKLLPYYKRFTPATYASFRERLNNPNTELVSFIKEIATKEYSFIEITPNASFYDLENNDNLNPNFQKNFKGGYLQPKLSKYRNQSFFDMFGQVEKDANGNYISATKNEKLFNAYKAVMALNFKRLNDSQVSSGYNYYTPTQIRQGSVQRTANLLSGLSVNRIKDALHNATNFTEDDMEKGDTRFGGAINIIPQQYIQKVPPTDLSTEVFYSIALGSKAATLRKARVKYYGDIMSLQDSMLRRDYNGKEALTTNTIKMAKSAIDNSVFGINETLSLPLNTPFGTVDIAKIAKNLLNYIKLRNLGFNVIVPFTGAITGKVTSFIESRVGDLIHKRSYQLGRAEFRKYAADSIKEAGVINPKGLLNVMGRYFGVFDIDESFKNSSYNKVLRALPRTAMMLHAASNFPIYAENLMGILHDYRVVNGKVINFASFRNQEQNKGKTRKQIETDWATHEGEVIRNYLDVVNGEMVINEKGLGEKLTKNGRLLEGQELKEEISLVMNNVAAYARYLNEIVDGTLSQNDRLLANRNFLTNFLTTHRGWLSVYLQRRLKGEHFNWRTNTIDEGSYRSVWNFFGRYIKEYRGKNFANVIGNFKELYQNGSDIERANLRRVGIEFATLNFLVGIGLLLMSAADEEENQDMFALQLSAYLYSRTMTELSGTQLAIGSNLSEVISAPVLGYDTIVSAANITEAFDEDVVQSGSYRGMTKSERYFTKLIPGAKQYHDLTNLYQTRNTYSYFNDDITQNYTLTGLVFMGDE